MAEPSTASFALITSLFIAIGSLLHGVDAPLLVGASSGASLFVISAKDLCLFTRIIYLAIATAMGYHAAPALAVKLLGEPTVAAFIISATVIGLGLRLIDWVDKFDIEKWLRGKL